MAIFQVTGGALAKSPIYAQQPASRDERSRPRGPTAWHVAYTIDRASNKPAHSSREFA